MIDPMIKNLQTDFALMQTYITRRQAAGFHDMERMLEALTIHIFKALNLGNLVNKNLTSVNFPAIDLADEITKVAVQVTSNASPAKIKKTISAFEKEDKNGASLKSQYDKLYIFGFCKISKNEILPEYCEVIGTEFIISELFDRADEESIQEVMNAVRRHQSYASLHPWEDKDSLEIVLNLINRNAIKHMMYCEGSVSDMTSGLNEISEIIGKGSVKGKERAKSISEFQDKKISKFLRQVLDDISSILAIVNQSKSTGSDFVCIQFEEREKINQLKRKIATQSSEIARNYKIPIQIGVLGG